MESDESRRARPEGEETGDREDAFPTGDESPRQVGRTVIRGLAGVLVARFFFLNGLIWLLVGGGMLTAAWVLVQGELARQERIETFSGRVTGTIEDPRWYLEGDPELLGDGTFWQAVVEATACARLRFEPVGAEETITTYCRELGPGLARGPVLTWEESLGPMPVSWVDERGMPRIELRLDPRLVRWLDERGPEVHRIFYDVETFHGPDRARRADRLLGDVWRSLDDPFLRMLEEWSKPPEVTVAYLPGEPSQALPLPLLDGDTIDNIDGGIPIWGLAVPFALFGLLAWGAGSYLVTGQRPVATTVLVVLGVVAIPWSSGPAVKLLGYFWEDAELAVLFLRSDSFGLPPTLELDVQDASHRFEGEGEPLRVAWTLEMSSYGDLFHWIDLEPPPQGLASDEVLRHLAGQVHRQAAALPDEELAALLAWATSVQERSQGEEIGLLFVDAALALRGDPDRSREVRWSADELLTAIALHPPSDNPHRLAVEERQRILARVPGPS